MSFMSLYGPFFKTGTRQNHRLVISDTAAVYSAEEFIVDPALPTQGYDSITREEIVIPKGTLVAVKPMPRTYRGKTVITIANGGVATSEVNGLPYSEGTRAANVPIGIAKVNITRRAYNQVMDVPFAILHKDAYIELPYVELINDSNGQLYAGAMLKSDTNGNFVLFQETGSADKSNHETSYGATMVPANVKADFQQIKGQIVTILPEIPSMWEEWMAAMPVAGVIDWTKPLMPYHDLKFNVIANPKGAVYNVGHANRTGALVTAVAMGANNAAKAGTYLLEATSTTNVRVHDIAAGTATDVTVAATGGEYELVPGVKVTLGAVTLGHKTSVDVLIAATAQGLKGINDMVAERPDLVGQARDAFRPFGVLRILLK